MRIIWRFGVRQQPLLSQLIRERSVKFFYTVSRFQNPTDCSYSNQEKKHIVELAQKYDVCIIEDDYMGDLDNRKKADPMFAYDPSGRVIYTKSFSKVLAKQLVEYLQKKNVLVQDATGMYLPEYRHENRIRLCVSQVDDRKIPVGVKKIGEGICTLVNSYI
ncbi:hypothetical protein ACOSZF_10315 [Cytobacillus firmus]|uniref:hypothetical protein n=1 Tax=Cytobacillus firmus TaxID=1399 RepID=UPI00077C1950|nr:hypothetical protein [Cytobacillus firmus]MBG9549087.1 hypothetical protein [Cytobacillus firmus]MBG9552470.1 hypothetical protein [Cytobacillus firmus]MBG9558869.1 hypothetical protein [Cytobacillus firmus]MBG9603052.1 hypothetical protein [Cytobacillus firmus]